jgi:hypothetical protein
MTREDMEAIWNKPGVREAGHVVGWHEGYHGRDAAFRGSARVPHAGEGRKLMARWKRENKRGYYGKSHISSEWTLLAVAAE